jgi:hypothetical protein
MLKESVTGGGGQTWTLDRDLAYAPIIFEDQNLPAFPDLPLDSKAHAHWKNAAPEFSASGAVHVDAILEEVFDPQGQDDLRAGQERAVVWL